MKQELEFKIEGKEWVSLQDAAFNKLNKKAKIDGFRPGKAPKEMFLKKYGVEALYMDAGDFQYPCGAAVLGGCLRSL